MNQEPFSIDQLKMICSGEVIQPDHTNYQQAKSVWNALINKSPQLIVQAKNVSDVVAAVQFAGKNNFKLAIRGGGHSVAGLSSCEGMVLDLSLMRKVEVDPVNKIVKIEGGATWADVDAATQNHGLVVTGGVVSETGVGGLTLGGGISWMRRKLGMSVDNLLGAEVVLADGQIVYTSVSENPDLFWAIRGGGGNFGVVTSFEFRAHELGPEVYFFAALFPISEADNVFQHWYSYTKQAPEEVSVDFGMWSIPVHDNFPPEAHGMQVVNLFGMYCGEPEQGKKIMDALNRIPNAIMNISGVYPYNVVQQMNDPYFPKGKRYYWKSIYLNELTPELIEKVISRGNNRPDDHCLVYIRHLGGAIKKVSSKETSFGDRNGEYLLSIDSSWVDPDKDKLIITWTRAFWDEVNQYSNGQVYLNFLGDEHLNQNNLQRTYGENLDRLRALKSRYDPQNLFNVNHNINPLND